MIRILFLMFFGYLVYRFLIKPVLLGASEPRERNSQEDMLEMIRRMQEFQQQRFHQQQPSQKTPPPPQKSKDFEEGDYIDYEEVKD